jgi:hypothetical protein
LPFLFVRKKPEIPSTPPKQKRVILELTLLQSFLILDQTLYSQTVPLQCCRTY